MLWLWLRGMVEGDGMQIGVALALLAHGRLNSSWLVLGLGYLEVDGGRCSGLLPAN